MDDYGSIACVCVTRPDRQGLCVRAIRSFADQSYPNKKLFVVCEGPEHAAAIHQATGTRDEIDIHHMAGSLADRYRFGLSRADAMGAKFVTFADDDDQSHRDRYARQIAGCGVGQPSFLSGALWHFYDSGEVFAVDFEERHKSLWTRVVHGSMVAYLRDVMSLDLAYSLTTANPGYGVARSMFDVVGDKINRAIGEWWWMKIGVRGCNVHGYDAHRRAATDGRRAQNFRQLRERRVWIDRLLDGYKWEGPIDVCGFDGVAYEYVPLTREMGLPPIGAPAGIDIVKEET